MKHNTKNTLVAVVRVVVAVGVLVFLYEALAPANTSTSCTKETVAEITAVDYRTVYVKFTDGRRAELYSPTVKPGETICVYRSDYR